MNFIFCRCSDAAAMLANISRHTLYITSTIGYIGDQVRLHPEIITETYVSNINERIRHLNLIHAISKIFLSQADQRFSSLLYKINILSNQQTFKLWVCVNC